MTLTLIILAAMVVLQWGIIYALLNRLLRQASIPTMSVAEQARKIEQTLLTRDKPKQSEAKPRGRMIGSIKVGDAMATNEETE